MNILNKEASEMAIIFMNRARRQALKDAAYRLYKRADQLYTVIENGNTLINNLDGIPYRRLSAQREKVSRKHLTILEIANSLLDMAGEIE